MIFVYMLILKASTTRQHYSKLVNKIQHLQDRKQNTLLHRTIPDVAIEIRDELKVH